MGADLVVRFAGEGGQGQVTAAEGMAEAAARVGYHVQTFATYPSQIEGGPVWAQTRISTNTILTQGDQLDVDRKSTRLNSSHIPLSRMPSSA